MGDPVCWLSETCLACGRFLEEPTDGRCPHCGHPLDDDSPAGRDRPAQP